MPPKTKEKKPKSVETLQLASANANDTSDAASQAMEDGVDTDDVPQVWEKVSEKILRHINDRFDKLELTLQAVQSSQKEVLEKVDELEEVLRC